MSNLFGLVNGKLIGEAPLYVDRSRRPGATDIPKATVVGLIGLPLLFSCLTNPISYRIRRSKHAL